MDRWMILPLHSASPTHVHSSFFFFPLRYSSLWSDSVSCFSVQAPSAALVLDARRRGEGGGSFCLHALYNTHQCNAMRQNIYTACMLITPVPLHHVAYSQPPTLSGSGNSCIHLRAHMDKCNGCHAAASPPPTLAYPPTRRNPTEPELRHLLSPRC